MKSNRKLWHRFLDHHHHHHSHHHGHHRSHSSHHGQPQPPAPLTPKQEKILQTFADTVTTRFGESWKRRHLILFLQETDWNMAQSLADMEDIQEANYGLLAAPPLATVTNTSSRSPPTAPKLLGCENDQGTSCYLDALLFAMYIGQTSFDPMLLGDPFAPVFQVSTPVSPTATPQQEKRHNYRHRHHRFFSRYQENQNRPHRFFSTLRSTSEHQDYAPSGLKSPALHIDTNLDDLKKDRDRSSSLTSTSTATTSSVALQQKHHLQRTLRLFVNKLRNGKLVKTSTVAQVRRGLAQAGWYSQDPETHKWKQEDVSELFLFLTSIFDQPYLPFQLRLFHGANKDMDDDRIMTDRLLPLSLPAEHDQQPIRLETILVDHFYNSVVSGVKRNVDLSGEGGNDTQDPERNVLGTSWNSSSSSGSMDSTDKGIMEIITTEHTNRTATTTTTNNTTDHDKGKTKKDNYSVYPGNDDSLLHQDQPTQKRVAEVDAWQAMELLPFYSSSNEQGGSVDDSNNQHYLDTHLVLPIVLKRYKLDPHGGGRYSKETCTVLVPETIPFRQFVNRNSGSAVCSQCSAEMDYVMTLKSVVCHQGSTPHSGHYIAYAKLMSADPEHDTWLKFDDLKTRQRIEPNIKKERVLEDASKQGYLFFYELNRLCPSCFQRSMRMALGGDHQNKEEPLSSSSMDKAALLAQEQYHIDEWYPSAEDIPPVSSKSSQSTKSEKCRVM